MKWLITILISLFIVINVNAQYFPVFSQYLTNGLVINPAYAGSREVLSAGLFYRNQMSGFKGSPNYEVFSVHTPLKNSNVGLGLLVLNENVGPVQNSHLYFNYAYKILVGYESKIALGFKAGINYCNYNLNKIFLNDPADPSFAEGTQSFLLPNIGGGLYYYSTHFFLGLSIPYFLSYKEKNDHSGYTFYNDFNNYNFLLTSGYLFDFSNAFRLKPTIMFKYYGKKQQQLDLNMTFILFNDKIWIGGIYRMNEAIGGTLEVQINPQFRFCYSYEYTGGIANYFNYTSHEIGIRYEFNYKIKAFNPRYF